jgi:Ca2+-binding RTX toxin-like protein
MGENVGLFTQGSTTFNSLMLTQNFGIRGASVFLGGVAFVDADGDNFYDVGEARGGVAIAVHTTGGASLGSTTGEAAGAYAVPLAPQTLVVTFSGAGLPAAVSATVDATQQNAKVDLVGTGKLLSSATITLGAGAVDVTLLGVANINATGNTGANRIEGNKGNNALNGGLGVDTLVGGNGNDTYYINDRNAQNVLVDSIVETATGGIDVIATTWGINLAEARFDNIENAFGYGTANVNLIGDQFENRLTGNDGNNFVAGRGGRDLLWGAGGIDRFVYVVTGDTGATAATRDVIYDFAVGVDDIDLGQIDTNTSLAGDQAFIFRAGAGAQFVQGSAPQVRFFHEAGGRTIIEGDMNGDRVADFQIQLEGVKALTSGDFLL